jgi:hypothetical protein
MKEMRLTQLLKEVEEKAEIDALSQAMGDAFKTMGAELQGKEKEIQNSVEQSDAKMNEALGVIGIVGIILAAPKVLELFVKGMSKLVAVYKKIFKPGEGKGKPEEMAAKIIDFTHKWHKMYIKGVKWILKITGAFKKAGIEDDAAQMKAAELVYYIIIAGLAVYSGVGAVSAFKAAATGPASGVAGQFSLGALETAMASVKSAEVSQFLGKMGLKAAGA